MPAIAYRRNFFRPRSKEVVKQASKIIAEYQAAGFSLTLRQLYYQFVSRGLFAQNENTEKHYKRLSWIISDARLCGLIDWDAITDRLRRERRRSEWNHPQEIIRDAHDWYHMDLWGDQKRRPEVWVEKDALTDIVRRVCDPLGVGYMVCRGYSSQTAVWEAAQRMSARWENEGQGTTVIYVGDHDPSGLDMSRDVTDRLSEFTLHDTHSLKVVRVKRVALNMDQIKKYKPPPNPAKVSDARAAKYIEEFGDESWELDALDPKVLMRVISDAVNEEINDPEAMERAQGHETKMISELALVRDRYADALKFLNKPKRKRKARKK